MLPRVPTALKRPAAAAAAAAGALYVPSGALWGAQDTAKLSTHDGLAFAEYPMRETAASLRLFRRSLRREQRRL